ETRDSIDFFPSKFYSAADPPAGWPLPPQFVPPFTLPKEFSYRNIGKTVDKGLELSGDFHLAKGFSASATYTWQDKPELSDDDPLQPLVVNLPPNHQYTL